MTADRPGIRGVPRGVVVLGLVSLCMDLSSEMIHALLPVFLVSTLGASALTLGWIEGVAEATASVAKLFSGVLSDAWGRRKPLVALGYGLAAASKPLFPLASAPAQVLAARFIDRIGKGLRGAPRDALIADLTPAAVRGASYGLRQTLDTLGALGGPLLAVGLMAASSGNVRLVFWVAAIPAVGAVLLVLAGVEDVAPEVRPGPLRPPLRLRELAALRGPFAALLVVAVLGALARFSEAFLVLRALDAGLSATLVPLTLVAMNAAYAASSYPAGALSDRLGRPALLGLGFGVLAAADLALALASGRRGRARGGRALGPPPRPLQGLFSALVADAAPPGVRGSAFGVYHLTTGAATLAASVLAGALWDGPGPEATFLTGAALAGLAAGALALLRSRWPQGAG